MNARADCRVQTVDRSTPAAAAAADNDNDDDDNDVL